VSWVVYYLLFELQILANETAINVLLLSAVFETIPFPHAAMSQSASSVQNKNTGLSSSLPEPAAK
jgi:hypothetical protein